MQKFSTNFFIQIFHAKVSGKIFVGLDRDAGSSKLARFGIVRGCAARDRSRRRTEADNQQHVSHNSICQLCLYNCIYPNWQCCSNRESRESRGAKKRRFAPNREALNKIPNRPNRYLMTPLQWELRVVAQTSLLLQRRVRTQPCAQLFLETRRLGWLET